jgi:hypothetical protein
MDGRAAKKWNAIFCRLFYFYPEDRERSFIRNIGSHLCGYTMSPAPKSAKINVLDKRGI